MEKKLATDSTDNTDDAEDVECVVAAFYLSVSSVAVFSFDYVSRKLNSENFMSVRCLAWLMALLVALTVEAVAVEKVPDKLVVLTFDDSVVSQHLVARPILKKHGFGATFFITEGFSFPTNKRDYLTWQQIAELHNDGFEIGNHTRDHMSVTEKSLPKLREQLEAINARCQEHGIPKPVSFAYPGNGIHPAAFAIFKEFGIQFARRGGAPEFPYEWGRGFAYEPGVDHPLLIPSAGDARPDWTIEDFKRAVAQARDGRVAVLQFHGVPDGEHHWVSTSAARFEEFMKYLKDGGFKVISLRDLAQYVDSNQTSPADPFAVIQSRQQARPEALVELQVVDAADSQPIPARVYIQNENGDWFFPKSANIATGSAVRYERKNGANPNAIEMHTTVSAHPFRVELLPGRYTVTVERGHESLPLKSVIEVGRAPIKQTLPLRRWIDMNSRGWWSGDTHSHRDPRDLPNVVPAEDLNVSLPMVYWTTESNVAPNVSARNFKIEHDSKPFTIAPNRVWYPVNSEYEIFKTDGKNHTLGAFLVINHKQPLDLTVLPLRAVADRARAEGALIDLEKHNWNWSIAVVPLLNVDLFELGNNHHWRTEYAVRNWAIPAPPYMKIRGTGTDTEDSWTLYGFQTYYALLNCGFRIRPTAGTANGAHPVPLGFNRVYVQLDEPFSYDAWMRGLGAGRSFVSNGPMPTVKLANQWPGHVFCTDGTASSTVQLTGTVSSQQPLSAIEVVINGDSVQTIIPQNVATAAGGFETVLNTALTVPTSDSSWVCLRCWEPRSGGRMRFAHTAPWHFEVANKPPRPTQPEINWLIERVQSEITRNEPVLPAAALDEFRSSLATYQEIAKRAR